MLSGTTSMSPVGCLGFLLARSRTVPVTEMVDSLLMPLIGVHDLLGLDDDLRRAVEITQDEKGEVIADHADIFHPADQRDVLADVFHAELAAGMGS